MTETRKLTALILAGGKAKPDFVAATGVTNRALVELAPGRVMLDFILDALVGAQSVGEVFVVGELGDYSPAGRATVIAPGSDLIDNILIGCEAAKVRPDLHALLVSADIPFIDPAAVDGYAAAAVASGGDFCYPIIPMADYNRQFAVMKRTTLKVREGAFTGGNIMLMRAGVVMDNPSAIRASYAARKSVVKLGGMMGWGLLLRIVLSQIALPNLLDIQTLEKAVGRVLGPTVEAKAIITPHASIGTDVDKPEDVRIAREMLGRPSGAAVGAE